MMILADERRNIANIGTVITQKTGFFIHYDKHLVYQTPTIRFFAEILLIFKECLRMKIKLNERT